MSRPVIFCVEGSHQRGMGHVYRSLRVASALRSGGRNCLFVCNNHAPSLALLREAGFAALAMPVGAGDGQWEATVLREHQPLLWWNDRMETSSAHVQALAVLPALPRVHVDDTGVGGHRASLRLLTMPCFFTLPAPAGVRQCAGVEYMLLDSALTGRGRVRSFASSPLRVLMSMGGSDTYGATVHMLTQLMQYSAEHMTLTCITGPAFEHEEELAPLLRKRPQWVRKSCVPCLFDEFDAHDVLFCGGGMTPFEAAATGLPVCICATEEHEEANAIFLRDSGCAVLAGQRQGGVMVGDFMSGVLFSGNVSAALAEAVRQLPALSVKGREVCDGRGTLRCAALVNELCHG